ncbi:MAG: FAD-dependent monooxygenase [Pseudonocardiaceae bacterium]|nr:FAD-dependent monooxygenase [Actinomycetota bacterium]
MAGAPRHARRPGGRHAPLVAQRICWRDDSTFIQVSKLAVQVDLQRCGSRTRNSRSTSIFFSRTRAGHGWNRLQSDKGYSSAVNHRTLTAVHGPRTRLDRLRWGTRFSDASSQQVVDYRVGRVLFAGDSAHIHSPIGGRTSTLVCRTR